MSEYIHFTIPIYYTQTFKTKKDKTFLVGLNWYRSAHYFIKNEVKKHYNAYIISTLRSINAKPIKGKYEIALKYYYKNVVSDLDNVCGMGIKHLNDAFQAYGLVDNDNVKHCVKVCYYVAKQDREDPRLEVFVRKIEKEDNEH